MNSELQHQLDRLVDRELSADEMSELLKTVEANNAWKQCALTLIESAELRSALKEMMGDQPPIPVPARRSGSRLLTLTVAVCLAGIAFVAGRHSQQSEPQMVQTQPSVDTPDSRLPQPDPQEPSRPTESIPNAQPIPSTGIAVVGFAQVIRTSGVSPRYPVLSGEFSDTDLMELTAIPEHIRRRARSRGIEMERVPRVLTMQLEDGQRLAVPMDALGLRQTTAEVL